MGGGPGPKRTGAICRKVLTALVHPYHYTQRQQTPIWPQRLALRDLHKQRHGHEDMTLHMQCVPVGLPCIVLNFHE